MLHDRLQCSQKEFKSVLSRLEELLDLTGTDDLEEIHLHDENRKISISSRILPKNEGFLLILDYPDSEKPALEKAIGKTLPGVTRIPSLLEAAEMMLPRAGQIRSPKEELRDAFGLSKEQIDTFLLDLMQTSKNKRCPALVKDFAAMFTDEP